MSDHRCKNDESGTHYYEDGGVCTRCGFWPEHELDIAELDVAKLRDRVAELERQLSHAVEAGLVLAKERDEAREAARTMCLDVSMAFTVSLSDLWRKRWPWLEETT